MNIILSKKEVEFLKHLVEGNAAHCQSCGFNTVSEDKLVEKFNRALQGGGTSGRKAPMQANRRRTG